MNNWLILLKLSALFLLLFAVAEWLYHKQKVAAEYTRKLVHIGTGLLTLLFPIYFTHVWQVIVICTAFLLILILSQRFRFLPSVNAVARKTDGSILYPVVVCSVFAFYTFMRQWPTPFYPYIFFYLPVLVMAIADPAAALAGTSLVKKNNRKTMAGSVAFFLVAFSICCVLFYFFGNITSAKNLFFSASIAFATTLAERFSKRGWDNFTIPMVAAACLYLMV